MNPNSMNSSKINDPATSLMAFSYPDGSFLVMDFAGASPWELGDFLFREYPGLDEAAAPFAHMISQCWKSSWSPFLPEHPELSKSFLDSSGSLHTATVSHLRIYESFELLDSAMERRLADNPEFSGVVFAMSPNGEWNVFDQSDPHTWDFLPLEDLIAEHAHAA